jgi:peptide/nickel transport system permease protein
MAVLSLLARRLLLSIPIVLGVLVFTFLLVRVGGNDPVALLAGPTGTPQEIAQITERLKLDQPIWRQFWEFMIQVASGDLGRSWLSDRPVLDELLDRLPATLEIVLLGALIGAVVGVPAGLRAALRAGGAFDQLSRIVSLLGFGMPTIFLGLVLVFIFFFALQWAPPPMGRLDLLLDPPARITGSYLVDALLARDLEAAYSAAGRMVLPCAAIAIVFAAPLIKQTRAIALDVLANDFVRHARILGLPERQVRRIVWRNSAAPLVTYAATELSALFGAAAVLELIFAWGGISQFGLTAILRGDFAVIQGFVIFMSAIAIVVFAAADMLVLWLEPRARLERS